jgi:hypothetical protein
MIMTRPGIDDQARTASFGRASCGIEIDSKGVHHV